jgi:hypothetical protein
MNLLQTAEVVLSQELTAGERMLWAGQPRQGIVLYPSDALMIPFSLLWGGFAIFWEATVLATGAPWFFKLWGIPFVLVGLYLIFGRFLWDAHRRRRTFYALTNQRAIILISGISLKVTSVNLGTISDISLTARPDGTGTITFGPRLPFACWWPGGTGRPGAPQAPPAFEMIPNAQDVYRRARQAQTPT